MFLTQTIEETSMNLMLKGFKLVYMMWLHYLLIVWQSQNREWFNEITSAVRNYNKKVPQAIQARNVIKVVIRDGKSTQILWLLKDRSHIFHDWRLKKESLIISRYFIGITKWMMMPFIGREKAKGISLMEEA